MTRRLLDKIVRRLELPSAPAERARTLIDTEWIVTNGLGGYASSTMSGLITRRYHGLLVAALPNPYGRVVMLNHLGERVFSNGQSTLLSSEGRATSMAASVTSVRLEAGLPVWEYEAEGVRLEKRIIMPYRQNSVHITYRLMTGPAGTRLELQPAVHFRGYEDPVGSKAGSPSAARYGMTVANG